MRILIITICFLMVLPAFAARTWTSIEAGDQIYLISDLQIKNTNLLLKRNSSLRVKEVVPMDLISVVMYKVQAISCPGPSLTSELDLYSVRQATGSVTVGIELTRGCVLEIYVENTDLQTLSLFN